MAEKGLYVPSRESSACGVGMTAAIDGQPSRLVVARALEALKAVWHRGAVDADGKTGDGAGIHLQIPQEFFAHYLENSGHEPLKGRLAVGMVFLPRADLSLQEHARSQLEAEISAMGHRILGWRPVPVDIAVIGEKANATRPEIEQILIECTKPISESALETELYIARRRIEQQGLQDFYVCSLSCRSIIYKGLFLAEQLDKFYPDLRSDLFISNFAIYHQRYSTNTFPSWPLAQPFRILAHNGEINTISGNVNWMLSHQTRIGVEDEALDLQLKETRPLIMPGISDSAALDAACELLLRAGREMPETKMLLIPEAWAQSKTVPESHRAFYRYANAVMEAWDGPAAICSCDGRWALAGMDRNGLRPLRYAITGDDMLIVGSEAGMVRLDEASVKEKGRLGPGQSIAVDLSKGVLYQDQALKTMVAGRNPFGEWAMEIIRLEDLPIKPDSGIEDSLPPALEGADNLKDRLTRYMVQAGWSLEDVELILRPMAEDGKEATGSMGDDSPLAVLSDHYRPLHHYFRQDFAQVTNPPIDSLRERYVMSLVTRVGNLQNILEEDPNQLHILKLPSPVLLNAEMKAVRAAPGINAVELDCSFVRPDADDSSGENALEAAIASLQVQALEAVQGGCNLLVLTDEYSGPERPAIPIILAVGAVHSYLVDHEYRSYTSIAARSADVFETHALAVLISVGATVVNPWLAQAAIADLHARGLSGSGGLPSALGRFKTALEDGLLKIMSKMGISIVSSYRGGYNFEVLGLSRPLVNNYFPGLISRISGLGTKDLQQRICAQHERAWQPGGVPLPVALPVGGFYRARAKAETHGWDGRLIHMLQGAVSKNDAQMYQKFCAGVQALPPANIRDLLDFEDTQNERQNQQQEETDIEPMESLRQRLVAPGISLGALSPIAHETLAIAMNRIGAKSDSGEGGEDPARYQTRENGDNASSAIKQIASGRFGVTAEYLNACKEIEIKVAQGAKPGEGGQLPGIKVSSLIARLRHSTPGVTLISPPPHHDIYSIEDLAQLIYDLKQISPVAEICVKLVAKAGIGTVAAGVAKAKADVILVSGHSGGTGASPQSSIKYAGLPWEMGLAEVHQVLTLNGLRDRVRLRTDGGLKTGRDVMIAALLGAEEFGIGTASLVAMGCIMVRQCHSNTCPVGVCTQDPKLIERFSGSPEKVIRLFNFIAEEMRDILARLGAKNLEEVIGRTDLLHQVKRPGSPFNGIDLSTLLLRADGPDGKPVHCTRKERSEVPPSLDEDMLPALSAHLGSKKIEKTKPWSFSGAIQNTDRAVGTRISAYITRTFGMAALPDDHVSLVMTGSAGQSLGAFAVKGVRLEIQGDANDYVAKGLSGGTIIVRPPLNSPLASQNNAIIGNTCLYGATAGALHAAGLAGNRFAVRNSGALATVEGAGSNACEYMTGGEVMILGPVGDNFAAGMTGGIAYVYDPEDTIDLYLNPETVGVYPLDFPYWQEKARGLVTRHYEQTGSEWARDILEDWENQLSAFRQIVPHEILDKLPEPVTRPDIMHKVKQV